MKRFKHGNCIAHHDDDVIEFLEQKLKFSKNVLFIGTVGIDTNSLYFPQLLSDSNSISYKFIVEKRPAQLNSIEGLGKLHRDYLLSKLIGKSVDFIDVEIITPDGATVAGRNAARVVSPWLGAGDYSDIVIDSTGKSRGTCFPIVQQVIKYGLLNNINVHLLVASGDEPSFPVVSESNDRAEWMHGFQRKMSSDSMDGALKLWIPQLSEGKMQATGIMYSDLMPVAEICPIIPFPSHNPRRGDDLLFEFKDAISEQWGSGLMNVIYAHESNPLDVYRSITQLHNIREKVFSDLDETPVTILSPAGWRIGSLGMLLASIDLDLPIMYVETIAYSINVEVPKEIKITTPNHSWHLWLTGDVYGDCESKQN
jgi:hypothetical protein